MGLDAWFIKADGVWHQFQLAGPMPGQLDKPWPPIGDPDRGPSKGHEQGLFHSTSADLIQWEDRGVVRYPRETVWQRHRELGMQAVAVEGPV